ncbi:MAG TPA: hypothetical protein VMN78_12890 [Longimicrobiales bacterium]|nr:hypothetical protein [Longimicrobiales bacterium]
MIEKPYRLERETRETSIVVRLGAAQAPDAIATSDRFLDHMLAVLARYSGVPIAVAASGDLPHHLIEDVAIALGAALRDAALAARARYGHTVVPMDDALVEVALDAGDRPYYAGRLPSSLYTHFFRSLALEAKWTLHVRVLRGRDRHHIVEATFKALGMALRQALEPADAVVSTKGEIRLEGSC